MALIIQEIKVSPSLQKNGGHKIISKILLLVASRVRNPTSFQTSLNQPTYSAIRLTTRDKKFDFIWALRCLQSVFDLSLKRLPRFLQLALIFLPRGFRLSSLCQKEETCLPTYFSAWLHFGFGVASIWLT